MLNLSHVLIFVAGAAAIISVAALGRKVRDRVELSGIDGPVTDRRSGDLMDSHPGEPGHEKD